MPGNASEIIDMATADWIQVKSMKDTGSNDWLRVVNLNEGHLFEDSMNLPPVYVFMRQFYRVYVRYKIK